VRSEEVRSRIVLEVDEFGRGIGLEPIGAVPSPIRGAHGNEEFLLAFRVN
jgi:predicted rRNA methylase YqxC with S4 and FtsJ domains